MKTLDLNVPKSVKSSKSPVSNVNFGLLIVGVVAIALFAVLSSVIPAGTLLAVIGVLMLSYFVLALGNLIKSLNLNFKNEDVGLDDIIDEMWA